MLSTKRFRARRLTEKLTPINVPQCYPEIAVRSLKDRFDWTILICTTILTLVGTVGTIIALRTLYAITRQAAIMDEHRISLEQLAKAAAGNAEAASKNAESSRLNAEEQARVARIMEHDLRYRITPHLQFRGLSGSVSDLPAEVQNVGRGVAENVTGVVTYVPSDRQEELILPGWIEPDKVRNVRIHQRPSETGYCVKLSCTDSVELNTYTFTRDQDGRINVVREPRRAEI